MCELCGSKADKKCSGCGKVSYCQRSHQIADWKTHKSVCKNLPQKANNQRKSSSLLFTELHLQELGYDETDEEESEVGSEYDDEDEDFDGDNVDDDVDELKKDIDKLSPSLQGVSSDELLKYLTNENTNDSIYQAFMKTIKKDPEQVIRYDRGGTPLLCSKNSISNIEPCQCGSERQFEFQIMPQLLSYMDVDTSLHEDTIDWGSVMVYTCKSNCTKAKYSTEFSFKQDFDQNKKESSEHKEE